MIRIKEKKLWKKETKELNEGYVVKQAMNLIGSLIILIVENVGRLDMLIRISGKESNVNCATE